MSFLNKLFCKHYYDIDYDSFEEVLYTFEGRPRWTYYRIRLTCDKCGKIRNVQSGGGSILFDGFINCGPGNREQLEIKVGKILRRNNGN